jgi:hypothetical protein
MRAKDNAKEGLKKRHTYKHVKGNGATKTEHEHNYIKYLHLLAETNSDRQKKTNSDYIMC